MPCYFVCHVLSLMTEVLNGQISWSNFRKNDTLLNLFFSQLHKDSLQRQNWCHIETWLWSCHPLCVKPVLDWAQVTRVCWGWFRQPASQSVPCGPIIPTQTPPPFYLLATHNESLPTTSEKKGGEPVTWGCVCVCVCARVCAACPPPEQSLFYLLSVIIWVCCLSVVPLRLHLETSQPGAEGCVCSWQKCLAKHTQWGIVQASVREKMKRHEPMQRKKSSRTTKSITFNPSSPSRHACLCIHWLKSLFVCMCVCSQVQEHGDGWSLPGPMPPSLPQPPGGGAESRLAEEAAQHHEELAAPLVRAALGSALLLQRRGRNQTTGVWAQRANESTTKQSLLPGLCDYI